MQPTNSTPTALTAGEIARLRELVKTSYFGDLVWERVIPRLLAAAEELERLKKHIPQWDGIFLSPEQAAAWCRVHALCCKLDMPMAEHTSGISNVLHFISDLHARATALPAAPAPAAPQSGRVVPERTFRLCLAALCSEGHMTLAGELEQCSAPPPRDAVREALEKIRELALRDQRGGFNHLRADDVIAISDAALAKAPPPRDAVREALEPFARLANKLDTATPDTMTFAEFNSYALERLCVGDLRRAVAALVAEHAGEGERNASL